MTDAELMADIQKQLDAGFSTREIHDNLIAKGISENRVVALVKPVADELKKAEAEEKKQGGKSWIFLVMALLGFVRAGLQSGRGQSTLMAISLILAITWVGFFIYELTKK